jgi:hypothetical protein
MDAFPSCAGYPSRETGKDAMDWFVTIDAYCERVAPGFGAEPFNMLTGLAFLVVGVFAYRRALAPEDRHAAAALGLVGLASAMQHSFAVALTLQADVAANLLYLVLLGVLMLRRLARLGIGAALAGAMATVALAYATAQSPVPRQLLGFDVDMFALLLIVILVAALALRARDPAMAGGIARAGAVLAAGLPFRFLDGELCGDWPLGTHGLWHLFNAGSSALLLAALGRGVSCDRSGTVEPDITVSR